MASLSCCSCASRRVLRAVRGRVPGVRASCCSQRLSRRACAGPRRFRRQRLRARRLRRSRSARSRLAQTRLRCLRHGKLRISTSAIILPAIAEEMPIRAIRRFPTMRARLILPHCVRTSMVRCG
ncbi:hypothetical protein HMPREF0972_00638 [Actinomyces sp. oral taxon 848 str. F0332]|nr:hypothetical protein HMPREF0972_00638 [Actinomyces sp. oral taxon 848 str. F0332]